MTTLTTDTHREKMLQWLDAGRSDEFLTMAAPYLAVCPDDVQVRLFGAREYLKLGLIGPACEQMEPGDLPVDLPEEFAAVRDTLSRIPARVTPWSSRERRFEANIRVLSDRGVDVDSIRDSWNAGQDRFEVFTDVRGVDQVRMRGTQGGWQWIPVFGDHRATAEALPLPDDIGKHMPGPYIFEGLDLGWLFRRVYDATRDTFLGYSCPLFVLEPDPALIALVMHLHDWPDIFSDERVFWFVGDACTDRLRTLWTHEPDLALPRSAFRLNSFRPPADPGAIRIVEAAANEIDVVLKRSLADLEARYASRDRSYYARRFDEALSGEGPPLRILAAVSIHTTFLQYSMRDAKHAFEELGHQCVVLTEQTPYGTIGPLTYHDTIRELDPDLFFNMDHLRPEFEGLLPSNLPLLTWDQDQLPQVFTRKNIERIGKLDFVAGYSKIRCLANGCNPAQLLQARVPTCPEQFSGDPLSDDERTRYTCDVAYVSHASQTPKSFHEQERAAYKDENVKKLLDVMYELTPPALEKYDVMGGYVALMILDESVRRCGFAMPEQELRDRLVGWYLWRLGDRLFRHQALEWVADWARRTGRSLRIYGNGWDEHPTLAPFAAGPADNGRELLCVYRAAKINLQLMPAGFVHQRALDGLAGGGFFLSRTAPSDVRGLLLRRLDNRIRELGIGTTSELLASSDDILNALLKEYLGEWLTRIDPRENDLLNQIRSAAEPLQAEEVFPHLNAILFDSAATFAEKADRFIDDREARRTIVDEMRRVVVDRFSYRPTMNRFLHAMSWYLRNAAE